MNALVRLDEYRARRAELAEHGLTKADIVEWCLHISLGMPVVTVDEFEAVMTAYEEGEIK